MRSLHLNLFLFLVLVVSQNLNAQNYNSWFPNEGKEFTSGTHNTLGGYFAGDSLTTGKNNTYFGYKAGASSQNSSGNVFLGYQAGRYELGSNKLYISNSSAEIPLIFGDFNKTTLGIGTKTIPTGFTMSIEGGLNINDGDFALDGTMDAKNLNVVGTSAVGPGNKFVAHFENTSGGDANGISIKIDKNKTSKANNFVTFYNKNNEVTGRIEGFDLASGDSFNDFPYEAVEDVINAYKESLTANLFNPGKLPIANLFKGELPDLEFTLGKLPSLNINFLESKYNFKKGKITDIGKWFKGKLPDLDFDQGLLPILDINTFFTPPTQLDIQKEMQPIICWALANDLHSLVTTNPFDLAIAAGVIQASQVCQDGGVVYGSGGADYAEWLPRLVEEEKMLYGQIVGVKGGKISKNTEDVDQYMVISKAPIILGNMPPEGEKDQYEKVAFLGQVPVMVMGETQVGDYIIPSGKNDGIGLSVSPNELTLEQLPLIVGRAWSASDNDTFSYVNVAIGLNKNDIANIVAQQQKELDNLKTAQSQMEAQIKDILTQLNPITETNN